jgi:hypothetical protein
MTLIVDRVCADWLLVLFASMLRRLLGQDRVHALQRTSRISRKPVFV